MSMTTHNPSPGNPARHPKRRGATLNRSSRRRRPLLEVLDERLLITVALTIAGNIATIAPDVTDTDNHTITLSETQQAGVSYLRWHDTVYTGGVPATVTHVETGVPITASSPITIDVALGNIGSTLALDGSWSFTNPVVYAGGAGTDVLDDTNLTSSNAWHVTGTGAGDINGSSTLQFTSVDLFRGAGTDTLVGDANPSTWTLNPTGSAAGLSTYNDGSGMPFTGFGSLTGGAGNNNFAVVGDSAIDGYSFPYNLTGGAGTNVFAFSGSSSLNSSIDGTFGLSSLDLSLYTSPATVQLTGSNAAGFLGVGSAGSANLGSGFTGIQSVSASSSVANTLIGEDVASTWALAGLSSTYSDGPHILAVSSGFQYLQGGSGVDTFNVSANTTANLAGGAGNDIFAIAQGVTLTGTVSGQAGTDTLDLSAVTSALSVVLTGSDVTGFTDINTLTGTGTDGVTGGFSGIDTLTSGSNLTDILTGEDVASTWALGATFAGLRRRLRLADLRELQGPPGRLGRRHLQHLGQHDGEPERRPRRRHLCLHLRGDADREHRRTGRERHARLLKLRHSGRRLVERYGDDQRIRRERNDELLRRQDLQRDRRRLRTVGRPGHVDR